MVTAAKVANANKGELLGVTYTLLLESLDNIKKFQENKNEKEFNNEVQRARNILQTLIDTLDFTQEVAKNLLNIYVYINGLLIKSLMKYDSLLIEEAKDLINILLEGWNEVIKDNKNTTKVMDNAQHIYAGLTYGKGNLNESVLDDDNRGFKA